VTLILYGHPFSSYTQKALLGFYEADLPVVLRVVGEDPDATAAHKALWPIGKFPVLEDAGRAIAEASVILEHLQRFHGGAALIPDDPAAALEVRFLDRLFDNYVMAPVQHAVGEALRPEGRRETALAEARAALDVAYAWLDTWLAGRAWASGEAFTLADCAAAPALFYADWTQPLGGRFPAVGAYRARLLARPSFARAVEEARPYRPYFPLGAPDRD
jgi:glutathione S-transferase